MTLQLLKGLQASREEIQKILITSAGIGIEFLQLAKLYILSRSILPSGHTFWIAGIIATAATLRPF
jgi:hypothetical protein